MGTFRLSIQAFDFQGTFTTVCFLFALILWGAIAHAQQPAISSPLLEMEHRKHLLDLAIDPLYHPETGLRGAASCSASSCHGGPRPGVATPNATRGSEYALWKENDPHARSWRTLASKESSAILNKLKILQDGVIVNRAAYNNCLACHNTTQQTTDDLLTPTIAEGVGCEMCHGPSGTWYDRHFMANETVSSGMTNIRPLMYRAKMCTTCHVGSRDRDMNHEIIAAGHPALYFDMAVYHERYPKHWREPDESSPNKRARLWLAGQIAMADAELELIETRTTQSHSVSTWPEFSIYRCTDCHAPLQESDGFRPKTERKSVISGKASLRSWNIDGLYSWQTVRRGPSQKTKTNSSSELKELLESRSESQIEIARLAKQFRSRLNAEVKENGDLEMINWNRERQLEIAIDFANAIDSSDDWELATRFYLSAWAASPQSGSKDLQRALTIIRKQIIFPPSTQLPLFPRPVDSTAEPIFEAWSTAMNQTELLLIREQSTR